MQYGNLKTKKKTLKATRKTKKKYNKVYYYYYHEKWRKSPISENWLEMAEPVLFSFVQNHDPYIPRENEKKKQKTRKTKNEKKLLPLLLNLFEPIFWTFLYQTVMNFYFTFTLLSIEVWIFTNETNEASRGRNRGGDLLSAASKIILFFFRIWFSFFLLKKK